MKLIHCSDIHLDSKMETHLSAEKALQRNTEICRTFERMVRYAQENQVSVIMISGDMFDTKRVTRKTANNVLSIIRSAEDITFLYLRGNHDECERVFSGIDLPDNLNMFSEDWRYFSFGNVVIAGIEIYESNCQSMYSSLELDPKKINIIMLHGQTSASAGSGAISLPLLRSKGIDYAAFGHKHSYEKNKLDDRGYYCYSGCLEGRGFDECGEKGFVLLETSGSGIQSKFIPFAKRTMTEISLDITSLTSGAEIQKAAEKLIGNISEDNMVKLVLTGRHDMGLDPDTKYLMSELENRFFLFRIEDKSQPAINIEDYKDEVSLKGEFIRRVMADADIDDDEKNKIIQCGIQALSGEAIVL